ncbi:uncharacterized protein PV09_06133 [Verruconis gallopava]|uniref:Ketoreductase (KR) domain-containing protein n=1 Tax=Verruconis gallopava TaxID=253628 RepID=A0A0D2A7Y4_9PEZI|nr:uncharacterized protein PV09_06133 [Verruconis gallopava]KIW02695.1 hypothetical protein PV09_06133 [Verruconis gallopava]
MGVLWSQMFPPAPTLTESNLPPQAGRVFIVTGGYSGIGLELVKMLYRAGGTVYIAGRSSDKASHVIEAIEPDPVKRGQRLEFIELDLSDLETIRPFVETFKAKQQRLDVLWNNAGISSCPPELRTKQGLEMQMGTNAVGPYLLTVLLQPLLEATAKITKEASVRVVWTASISVEAQAPKNGMDLECLKTPPRDRFLNYAMSKVANVYLCAEMAKQAAGTGTQVLHVVQNPGNLATNLVRYLPWLMKTLARPLLYDAKFGAYTCLWGGLSEDLTLSDQGAYLLPWGRRHPNLRPDIVNACKTKEEGGSGHAAAFTSWCGEQVRDYK